METTSHRWKAIKVFSLTWNEKRETECTKSVKQIHTALNYMLAVSLPADYTLYSLGWSSEAVFLIRQWSGPLSTYIRMYFSISRKITLTNNDFFVFIIFLQLNSSCLTLILLFNSFVECNYVTGRSCEEGNSKLRSVGASLTNGDAETCYKHQILGRTNYFISINFNCECSLWMIISSLPF
jgi:hypothetical protein